jgi:hypothetical protein
VEVVEVLVGELEVVLMEVLDTLEFMLVGVLVEVLEVELVDELVVGLVEVFLEVVLDLV